MGTLLIVFALGHILTAILIVSYTARNNKSKSAGAFLLSKLLQVAQRLRRSVENAPVHVGAEIKYTISIGVATVTPDKETTVDVLYRLSDHALRGACI